MRSSREIGMTKDDVTMRLDQLSQDCKSDILKMSAVAESGHPGSSISSLDLFIAVVYVSLKQQGKENILLSPQRIDQATSIFNDMFVISNGHSVIGWYALLMWLGIIDRSELVPHLRSVGSAFSGHPEKAVPTIVWETGVLGQGLSAACGKALLSKMKNDVRHFYVFMGDGEQQKGQISEALRFISKYDLTNLTVLIDCNGIQVSGKTSDVMPQEIGAMWNAAGIETLSINGHDFNQLITSIEHARNDISSPYCIIANTISGNGISFMEGKTKFVAGPVSVDECKEALLELGSNDDLDSLFHERDMVSNRCNRYRNYDVEKGKENFQKVIKKVERGPNEIYNGYNSAECREAFGNELCKIAEEVGGENLYVFNCDLGPAMKTNLLSSLYPSSVIETGLQEHHAATASGAMSAEGPIVFFSTFARFGLDECFSQHYMNQLNDTNLKTVLSHTGFVGQDGRTHCSHNHLALVDSLFGARAFMVADANHLKFVLRHILQKWSNDFVFFGRDQSCVLRNDEGLPYYSSEYVFRPTKPDEIFSGRELSVVSYGSMLQEAYKACVKLRASGYQVGLINVTCPTSIDVKKWDTLKETRLLVVEDHNISNGLYMRLCAVLNSENIRGIGVTKPGPSGKYKNTLATFGLDSKNIENAIMSEIELTL